VLSSLLLGLLNDGQLDALALGERHPGLGTLTNNEHVLKTSVEGVTSSVLDVDDFEGTRMPFAGGNDTNTTDVVTSGDHAKVTVVEPDEVLDLASLKVDTDAIVDTDVRVGVADGAAIVGDNERHTTSTSLLVLDTAELVLSLLSSDTVNGELALHSPQKTEVLVGLLNGDNIHEASGESGISADLAVDLDGAVHDNLDDLSLGEGIPKTVAEENDKGQAFALLVGT